MTLPVPVRRKRFLAPLWVFIFGMVPISFSRAGPAGPTGFCREAWGELLGGSDLRLDGADRSRFSGRVRSRRRVRGGSSSSGGAIFALATLFGLGLCFLLGRTDHHDHVATVLLRCALDKAKVTDVSGETLQQAIAELRPRLLTAAEHDGHLDLVTGLEEPLDMALLGGVVVRVDLRTELDLLDDRVDLVLAGFPLLDGCFVLELAEVHELGDRRLCHRGHLDQVEVRFGGETQCVLDAYDADLLTIGANQTHFRDPDSIVDTRLADVCSPLLSGQGDSVVRHGRPPEDEKSPSPPWCARSFGTRSIQPNRRV